MPGRHRRPETTRDRIVDAAATVGGMVAALGRATVDLFLTPAPKTVNGRAHFPAPEANGDDR